jgi:hypothetical protein
MPSGAFFLIVRDASGARYEGRQMIGPQALSVETRVDTPADCTLVVTDTLMSSGSEKKRLTVTLTANAKTQTASGEYASGKCTSNVHHTCDTRADTRKRARVRRARRRGRVHRPVGGARLARDAQGSVREICRS